jgi:hypothetical protein
MWQAKTAASPNSRTEEIEMSELPDWVTIGAKVAERTRGDYAITTVKSITATLVVLDNGSRYHRDRLVKTGEKNKEFYGAGGPTRLMPAEQAAREASTGVVRAAADAVSRASFQVTERDSSAEGALDQMQEAINRARQELARIAREYGDGR